MRGEARSQIDITSLIWPHTTLLRSLGLLEQTRKRDEPKMHVVNHPQRAPKLGDQRWPHPYLLDWVLSELQ
jgi:hypothetical protein